MKSKRVTELEELAEKHAGIAELYKVLASHQARVDRLTEQVPAELEDARNKVASVEARIAELVREARAIR